MPLACGPLLGLVLCLLSSTYENGPMCVIPPILVQMHRGRVVGFVLGLAACWGAQLLAARSHRWKRSIMQDQTLVSACMSLASARAQPPSPPQ